jgi:AcrR family transcriptional regulator
VPPSSRKAPAKRALAIGSPKVPRRAVPKQRPGQPGGPRDEARRERVRALCGAAVKLFVERGIDAVRVDDITSAADVAKGAFYYYFRDVEDLTAAVFAPVADATEASFRRCREGLAGGGELGGVYQRLAADLASTAVAHLDVVRLYLQERRGPDRGARRPIRAWSRRLEAGALWLVDEARRHHAMREELPHGVVAHAVLGAAEEVLAAALAGGDLGDPSQIARHLISLVLDGTKRAR